MKISIELEYDDLSDTQREGLKMLIATRKQHPKKETEQALYDKLTFLSRDFRLGQPSDALINKKGRKRAYSMKKPRGKVLNKLIIQTLGTTDRPMTIRELAKLTKVSHTTICTKLMQMRRAGIVDATSNHKNKLFFLRKPTNGGK